MTPAEPGAAAAPGQAADVFEQLLAAFTGAGAPELASSKGTTRVASASPAPAEPSAPSDNEVSETEVVAEGSPVSLALAQPWMGIAQPVIAQPTAAQSPEAATPAAEAGASGSVVDAAPPGWPIVTDAVEMAPVLGQAPTTSAKVAAPATSDPRAPAGGTEAPVPSPLEANATDVSALATDTPTRDAAKPQSLPASAAEAMSPPPAAPAPSPSSKQTAAQSPDAQSPAKPEAPLAPPPPAHAAIVHAKSVPAAPSATPPAPDQSAPSVEEATPPQAADAEELPTPSAPLAAPTRRREPAARDSAGVKAETAGSAPIPSQAAGDEAPASPTARFQGPTAPEPAKPEPQSLAAAPDAPAAAERPEGPRSVEGATTPAAGPAVAEAAAPRDLAAVVRGAPDTVAALAADIARKLEGRSTRFQLELQPAGLGRVEVQIEIGAAGKLTAAFAVESPQAAAELRQRAPELQRALEQAGFDLSGGLSFDLADNSRFGRDPEARQDGGAFRGRAFTQALANGDAADQAALPPKLARRPSAALDIRI